MEYFARVAEESARWIHGAELEAGWRLSIQTIEGAGVIFSRRERRWKCGPCCGLPFGDREEATMDYRFDIFKRRSNGNTLWITTVDGLTEAKRRMARLAQLSPGEYFVYLQGEGIVAELSAEQWMGVM
jgi:hypothetical protein